MRFDIIFIFAHDFLNLIQITYDLIQMSLCVIALSIVSSKYRKLRNKHILNNMVIAKKTEVEFVILNRIYDLLSENKNQIFQITIKIIYTFVSVSMKTIANRCQQGAMTYRLFHVPKAHQHIFVLFVFDRSFKRFHNHNAHCDLQNNFSTSITYK